jgi:hypothetical protein
MSPAMKMRERLIFSIIVFVIPAATIAMLYLALSANGNGYRRPTPPPNPQPVLVRTV